jgi:hypothetical protein
MRTGFNPSASAALAWRTTAVFLSSTRFIMVRAFSTDRTGSGRARELLTAAAPLPLQRQRGAATAAGTSFKI